MKLRGKLLLAIVPVIAGALLTLGMAVYVQLRTASEEEFDRQMDLAIEQTRERLDAHLETMRANARLFATSNLIDRYLREEDEGERYALMQPALLKLFSSYRDAYPAYREIRLVLPDGYEDTRLAESGLANASEEEGESDWFRAAVAAGGRYSTVFRSDDDGQMVLLAVHPVALVERDVDPRLARTRVRGYLAVTSGLDELERQVRTRRLGRGGFLEVLDPDGRVLFSREVDHVGKMMPELLDATDLETGEITHAIRLVHGASSHVRGALLHENLALIAVTPTAELNTARRWLAMTVALVTLGAIAVAAALLFLLLHRLVIGPLSVLGQRAREIGEGRLDATVHIERDDEIGELAGAFREMHGKLARTLEQLRGSHARIEELAFRDSLTGLPNRRLFLQLAEDAMVAVGGRGQRFAILFLDLDDFKRVNDLLGHDAGDELLQIVADRLTGALVERRAAAREIVGAGHVARLGGDEFTVLLQCGEGDGDGAGMVAARIVDEMTTPIALHGQEFVVGASVGVAVYPDDATTVEALMKCADIAMYEAKHADKNTWRRFDDAMQAELALGMRLERDLRAALEADDGQLHLHFQPQLDVAEGRFIGVEALLRWQHPELGRIGPDQFVPIAERTGLIRELGELVLDRACAEWDHWQTLGLGPMRMSVNVSTRQFALGDVRSDVERALEQYRMPPSALEIELTESCIMEAPTEVIATLERLRELGVRVAMDDFGTGYSSLGALLSLPIDTLKIDRSFITDIRSDTPRGSVVLAILGLAQGLGLTVVAEGVETETELDFLRTVRCDMAQGYLLGAPVTPEAVRGLLGEGTWAVRRAG